MTRWLLMGLLAATTPSRGWTDGKFSAAGHTFPVQVYVGVSFLYYVGSSQNVPFLGLGIGLFGGGVGAFSSSTAYFGLTPGVVATYCFNGPLSTGPFVGADIHITWLPSTDAFIANDFSLLATGGYRF